MFVYQNKDGHICVTFTDNKPVESPEYVIAVDAEAKALYMVAGEITQMPEQPEQEELVEEKIEIPSIEELDDVIENDLTVKEVVLTEANNTDAVPSVEELDTVEENNPEEEIEE